MGRRDLALTAIKDLIKIKDDEVSQVKSEIAGYKVETRKEQQVSEKAHAKLQSIRN
jgi:hypothetical protein